MRSRSPAIRPLFRALATAALTCVSACAAPVAQAPVAAPHATVDAPSEAIVFIENDYSRALSEARVNRRPLFIDAWAPWCHTCLSMRAFVFTDPKMKRLAKDFVWLAIDTESEAGDPFLAKYPMTNWPTLWVVDAEHEQPALKWIGSATADELSSILSDVKEDAAHGTRGAGEATALLARGDDASAKGDAIAAIGAYEEALAKAPPEWKKKPRALEALSMRLYEAKQPAKERDLAITYGPTMPRGTSRLNVIANGLDGALQTHDDAKTRALLGLAETIAADREDTVLADDRSSLYEAIVEAANELGDHARAASAVRAWIAFLEGEAARATTKEERAVFDAHRVDAYLAAGEPLRALRMLETSERDFPRDYNAPVRAARAYLALKRYDDALAAIDRAFTRVYGPRTLRLYVVKADILAAKQDDAALLKTIDDGLRVARTMTITSAAKHDVGALEKRRAAHMHR